jgi:integrase
MDRRSVHRYVAQTARIARIGRPIGPHALRRTVGTVGLNQGIPLRDIQRLLRHTRPETTLASYDISGDALIDTPPTRSRASSPAGRADSSKSPPGGLPLVRKGGLWDT